MYCNALNYSVNIVVAIELDIQILANVQVLAKVNIVLLVLYFKSVGKVSAIQAEIKNVSHKNPMHPAASCDKLHIAHLTYVWWFRQEEWLMLLRLPQWCHFGLNTMENVSHFKYLI